MGLESRHGLPTTQLPVPAPTLSVTLSNSGVTESQMHRSCEYSLWVFTDLIVPELAQIQREHQYPRGSLAAPPTRGNQGIYLSS